jgi:hypothetical protein
MDTTSRVDVCREERRLYGHHIQSGRVQRGTEAVWTPHPGWTCAERNGGCMDTTSRVDVCREERRLYGHHIQCGRVQRGTDAVWTPNPGWTCAERNGGCMDNTSRVDVCRGEQFMPLKGNERSHFSSITQEVNNSVAK